MAAATLRESDRVDRKGLHQDIWLGLWRALPDFRGKCSERTFVYRVALNRAITHVKRASVLAGSPAAESTQACLALERVRRRERGVRFA